MEELAQSFGVYAEALGPGRVYREYNTVYEEGGPRAFWLRVETEALGWLQKWIQRRLSVTLGSLGPSKHWVGELLLARFRDGQLYRARVENVDNEEVTVRYLDYGNSSSWLGREELAPWDSLLDLVPPQAVQCCFRGTGSREEVSSLQQHIAFRDALLASGSMRLEVHSSVGELLHVTLWTKEEENLLQLLCQRVL